MSKVYAKAGHDIIMLKDVKGESSYDVLFNKIPADLKSVTSHNNIVKHANKAINKQGAEIVLFEFGVENSLVYKRLNTLKKEKIKSYYYFKGKESKIYKNY